MTHLPIEDILPDLKACLRTGRNAVVVAPPGAGKTTLVPLALLAEEWLAGKTVLMLEPRRLAARAAAGRMATLLKEALGQTVGYRIRLESTVGPQTRIEVVTEAILTRRLQHDPALSGVGLVIFDEFHERSIHADLGLALSLDTQAALRDDLRILVMSATLEGEPVAELMGRAPILISHGRSFPVETRYRPPARMPIRTGGVGVREREVVRIVQSALAEHQGHILVFLPGAPEIRRCERLLQETGPGQDIIVAPLYGMLTREAQERAIQPPPANKRKVVLASAVAETSLTIEGVTVVIDAGFMRVPHFDPKSELTRLETLRVSRASADQRRGRAGRTAPGICYRLWRFEEDAQLARANEPEIKGADLGSLALELALWGVIDPSGLAWLDPPPAAAFAKARDLLKQLDAIDAQGRITSTGRRMAGLGLHPRLAHMLITSERLGLARMSCLIAALLSERDILKRRHPDIRERLEVLYGLSQGSIRYDARADIPLARRILDLAGNLEQRLAPIPRPPFPSRGEEGGERGGDLFSDAGLLLALAYPDRIAQRRNGSPGRYLLSGGRGAWLPPGDPLASEELLVVAELDGDAREGQIFLAAPIDSQMLEAHLGPHIVDEDFCGWDEAAQAVVARRQRRLGMIVLNEKPLSGPDQEDIVKAFLQGLRAHGPEVLPWTAAACTLRARIAFLARVAPQAGPWPDVTDTGIMATLEQWLAPYLKGMRRLKDMQNIDLAGALKTLLTWDLQLKLDELAPTHMRVPSGSRVPIDYVSGAEPILAVRLQEMFGCTDTPTIARGIPVVLHLLSPAGRPMQVTRDLASFWSTTYAQVRKDLRGRYPRHHWPEDPLEAMPTNRAKTRKT